jgi:hypothetical protein
MPTFASVTTLLPDPSCEWAGTPRDVLGFDSYVTQSSVTLGVCGFSRSSVTITITAIWDVTPCKSGGQSQTFLRHPEEGGRKFLKNGLPDYTVS